MTMSRKNGISWLSDYNGVEGDVGADGSEPPNDTGDDDGAQSGPAQNLLLCVLIMVGSGLLRVVATMVLAYPEHRARRNGEGGLRGNERIFFIGLHVLLLAVAAGLGIAGTIYGPVAIAVPVQTGSQLLLNILAMGFILKMRSFDKVQRTGTYIVALSVLSIMDVGPGTQDGQDVGRLLAAPAAIVWILLLSAGLIWAAKETVDYLRKKRRREAMEDDLLLEDASFDTTTTIGSGGPSPTDHAEQRHHPAEDAYDETRAFFVLLTGVTLSNVALATSGKCLGYLRGVDLFLAAVAYLFSAGLGLLFSITCSTACDQGIFTPASSAALIVLNMITGIIVWEDWKVVHAWVGYFCACLLMCCGVYLLTDIDLMKEYFGSSARTTSSTGLDELSIMAMASIQGAYESNTLRDRLLSNTPMSSFVYNLLEIEDDRDLGEEATNSSTNSTRFRSERSTSMSVDL